MKNIKITEVVFCLWVIYVITSVLFIIGLIKGDTHIISFIMLSIFYFHLKLKKSSENY